MKVWTLTSIDIPTDPETFSPAEIVPASLVFSVYIRSKLYQRGGPRRVVSVTAHRVMYRPSLAWNRRCRMDIVSDAGIVMEEESGTIAIEPNKTEARVVNVVR